MVTTPIMSRALDSVMAIAAEDIESVSQSEVRASSAMTESVQQQQKPTKVCSECGAPGPLRRTPRGLKCERCVSRMDSSGLGFR